MNGHWRLAVVVVLVATACGSGGRSIRVIGPSGEGVMGAVLVAVQPGAEKYDAWERTNEGNGKARIPAAAVHADSRLIVYAPGCRLVDMPMPESGTDIQLKPGIPVRLVLAEGYEFPDASLTLKAECDPIDRPAGLSDEFDYGLKHAVIPMGALRLPDIQRMSVPCLFDAGPKAADLLFPYPGRWRITFSLMRYQVESKQGSTTTRGSGYTMDASDGMTIVVEDGEDLQTIALSPKPSVYRGLLEDMRRE